MDERKRRWRVALDGVRHAGIALLAGVALLCGCAAKHSGEEPIRWTSPNLEQVIKAPLADTYKACIEALEHLNLPILEQHIDNKIGRVRSRTAEGEPTNISMERMGDAHTRVKIRAGLPPNKHKAARILHQIRIRVLHQRPGEWLRPTTGE